MVKLSDLQVALLLEEIACAMRVDTPILDSMRRLETRRLGGIARAAKTVGAGLERGESVADAFAAIPAGTSKQAAAAIGAAKKSGDPGLIERVAAQLRQRSDLARDTRLAWFYPWVLMVVGYLVAVLVMAPMIRRMHGTGVDWPIPIVGIANWLELNWWLPPLVTIVLFFCFLAWLFSRKRFPRQARLGLFCNSLADQFTHDVPEDTAIRAAAEMSGDQELIGASDLSLKSPSVARIVSLSDSGLGPVGTEAAGSGVGGKQLLIARLRFLGSIHTERARQQGYWWSRIVPRCAMVLIGGGMTLSYAWWVIAPVYLQVAQW